MNKIRPISVAQNFFPFTKEIDASGIHLKNEVRKLCENNSCGFYNTNWTCPPAVAPLDELKVCFQQFDTFVVIYEIFETKGSFDWKGMMNSAAHFKKKLQELKSALDKHFPSSEYLLLGMGACDICSPCSYLQGEPCRNPDDAIISLEACGIDVMKLMKDHDMKYYNGQNTITLVGGVLYRKESAYWETTILDT